MEAATRCDKWMRSRSGCSLCVVYCFYSLCVFGVAMTAPGLSVQSLEMAMTRIVEKRGWLDQVTTSGFYKDSVSNTLCMLDAYSS